MTGGQIQPSPVRLHWIAPALVFCLVAAVQLWLVAAVGTDIPYQDQWDAEGSSLYPQWQDGTFRIADVFQPHNEHRIVWTKLLDLSLFMINGQWDPLVQLFVGALLRAAVAAAIMAGLLVGVRSATSRAAGVVVVTLAFLPQLAWNNALWGFQSQVYFAVLFSVLALRWLGAEHVTRARLIVGFLSGIAAQLAMSAGAFVPVAVLALTGFRMIERRRCNARDASVALAAIVLLILVLALRVHVPEHEVLQARSAASFFGVLLRIAAWPHDNQPLAAFALNAPIIIVVMSRLLRKRKTSGAGEDFALLLGGWALAGAAAVAWFRGGSGEFSHGVPSRYVDFFVLLPIANMWCAIILTREFAIKRGALTRWCAGGWMAFLLVGWLGLSAQTLRGLILPRMRDRDAPVRLAVAFQRSNDPSVFAGEWRVIVPHPNPASVTRVLQDSRLVGVLPPSLQPDRPVGPLSRAVRWLLRR
jgi:hypothetical protein